MPRAILFDAVGTLIYPEPSVAEAYHRVGCELGSARWIGEIKELFRQAYRRSESLFALPGDGGGFDRQATSDERERQRWRQVVVEIFADLPPTAAEQALDRLWRHFSEPASWRVFEDVSSAWNELTRRGFRLGIASNFDSRLESICRGLAPLDRCRHLFISSQIGHPKPSPNFFRAVERALALGPEEILLVGDDLTNDVLGAQRCGWQSRHLSRDGSTSGEPIRSLRDLLAELTRPG